MQIFLTISEYRNWRNSLASDAKIGFVPTMGALHAGHASLIRAAASENTFTVVSIFVNPTQFGPKEDLSKYPRTLSEDVALAEKEGANIIFAPTPLEIYPESPTQMIFGIRDLDKKLCGASRPGHFNGVIQVVSLLFHIIQPHNAYFGQKDFQQFLIIKQLVKEQHFPVHIIGCPTQREADGLAMSSRNVFLNEIEREQARVLSMILFHLQQKKADFDSIESMKNFAHTTLAQYPLARLDYFEILSENNLTEIANLDTESYAHAFIAVFFGTTRLIDNLRL